MKVLRQRKYLFALLALLVVFAGCKGESPTAPQTGTTGPGGSPGGGTTPPVGAVITLTTSNANPLAGSTSTVTATVTVNGNPAPNGTAVEFSTTPIGLFQDSGTNTTIRTTTNGVATATLTAPTPGTATVTAVVNNVSRTVTVTFQARPVAPPPPADMAPAITAINPNQGRPEGGETVTITGRNFRGPVRVFFDFGNGVTREAIVTSTTANQIQVLTPAVDIGAGQTLSATIIVFTEQGTAAEQRITGAFTFRRASLTPRVTTVSPDSGPIAGGTRITIFGDGFEAPVQVSFSTDGTAWSQMQVLTVTFNQIIAITPTARDVNPNGSGPLTGPVDLRIININSNTSVIAADVFRYTPKMQITAVGPGTGSALGGTRVQIDGIGFEDPVTVTIAGVAAQVVSVTGTRVIAVTSPLVSPCTGVGGDVVVTNIENGDSATAAGSFAYLAVTPVITGVTSSGPIVPGSTVTISVLNPGAGAVRIGAGPNTIIPSPSINGAAIGVQPFTIVLPTTGFVFPTLTCTTASGAAGTQLGPLALPIVFTNVTTTCTDTLPGGLTVQPPGANACQLAPTATVAPTGVSPDCANAGAVVAAGTAFGTATITVSNAASARDLTITGVTVSNPSGGTITVVAPTTGTIAGGASQTFTVRVDPNSCTPVAPATTCTVPVTGTVNFATTDPARASIPVCVTGTGTNP